MTMVIENQNRQYGGMPFDSVYHHNPLPHPSAPQFTDPWASAHTSSHSNPPVYATSLGGINPVKQEDVGTRPSALSMSYSSLPVSAPSLVSGSTYSTSSTPAAPSYPAPDMMGMHHEMPRTTFDHPPTYTTASSMSNFAPASYAPLSYAPSLHPPHQDNRRLSHA